MSQALFRRWIREASEGIVSPAQITLITDRFMKIAICEMGGNRAYIPRPRDRDGIAERNANIKAAFDSGRTPVQISEDFCIKLKRVYRIISPNVALER